MTIYESKRFTCPVCHMPILVEASTEAGWSMVYCKPMCGGKPMLYGRAESLDEDSCDKMGAVYADSVMRVFVKKYTPRIWDTMWDKEWYKWISPTEIHLDEAFELAMKRKKDLEKEEAKE